MLKMDNSQLDSIAKRILHYRRQRKMSQETLGKKCGDWTQTRIGNYERGVRIPDQDTLNRIAKVLGVRPEYLSGPVSHVPVIKPEHVHRIISNGKIPKRIVSGHCPAPPIVNRSSQAFATNVYTPAMAPVFGPDDYSIVDPYAELSPGCYAMVIRDGVPTICDYTSVSSNDHIIGRITSRITLFY